MTSSPLNERDRSWVPIAQRRRQHQLARVFPIVSSVKVSRRPGAMWGEAAQTSALVRAGARAGDAVNEEACIAHRPSIVTPAGETALVSGRLRRSLSGGQFGRFWAISCAAQGRRGPVSFSSNAATRWAPGACLPPSAGSALAAQSPHFSTDIPTRPRLPTPDPLVASKRDRHAKARLPRRSRTLFPTPEPNLSPFSNRRSCAHYLLHIAPAK